MAPITINGNTLDPLAQAGEMVSMSLMAEDAAQSNYILIQTNGEPISKSDRTELEKLGAKIKHYVSEDTYLAEYKPTDLDAIRDLPFVTWANIYSTQFKVQASLRAAANTTTQSLNILTDEAAPEPLEQKITVDIELHDGAEAPRTGLTQGLAESGIFDGEQGKKWIQRTIPRRLLGELAATDEVKSVHPVHKMKLFNNRARGVLGVDFVQDSKPGWKGEGQVVTVADTGFDRGSTKDTLPAFRGRVVKLWPLGRKALSDDPDGHGTHVCGSVLGDGSSEAMGGKIQGTAPAARLAVQSLASIEEDGSIGLGGIPSNLEELFLKPYNDLKVKARIHTNSWGPQTTNLPYGQAEQIDDFVWKNQDMVILFAAGNEGADKRPRNGVIDGREIGLYSAAKNSITVGASENNRPEIPVKYSAFGYSAKSLSTDIIADKPSGMVAFSNRGPTRDNRIKPDVVAPGTMVLSASSRHDDARAHAEKSGFSKFCTDPDWQFMNGTSMATPLVADCCAAIRGALENEVGLSFIPSSLVKAILINGAEAVTGQYVPSEAGESPNPNSGWGRVNLRNSFPSAQVNGVDGGFFLSEEGMDTGDEVEKIIQIPDLNASRGEVKPRNGGADLTLKVTLVWVDPPYDILQNDLDLIVIDSDDVEYHGNKGATKTEFDRVNNIEQVLLSNVPPGVVKVKVLAHRLTIPDQGWSIAWSLF